MKDFKIDRYAAAQNTQIIGRKGQVVVDTTNNALVVHDGVTLGGVPALTASSTATLTNKTLSAPVISGGTIDATAIGATTPAAGSFTTLSATGNVESSGQIRSDGSGARTAITTTGGASNFQLKHSATGPVYILNSGATGVAFRNSADTGDIVLIDNSGLAVNGGISATTTSRTGGYTVATLPVGAAGDRAYVTDATTPTWNAALTGGGAVVVPVFKNATVWVSA